MALNLYSIRISEPVFDLSRQERHLLGFHLLHPYSPAKGGACVEKNKIANIMTLVNEQRQSPPPTNSGALILLV